jgi:hypothetical protein
MSDEDPFATTPNVAPDGSYVEITVKGGAYASHTVTSRRPTLDEVEVELAKAIKVSVEAQASLERAIEVKKSEDKPAAPGNFGKPAGADTPKNTDLPFANTGSSNEAESKAPTCVHGPRTLVTYKGQSGWVCSLPKGTEGRCDTVPA